MDSNCPVILVDLPFCYLPYDQQVRRQMRKIAFAEQHRRLCKAVRMTYNLASADKGGRDGQRTSMAPM